MLRYICIISVYSIFLYNNTIQAQSDPQFSQYMFINPYTNPASVGIDNTTNVALLIRYQWAGNRPNLDNSALSGSPISQMISGSTKLKAINSGIGAYFLNEKLAIINNINFKLNYAYHFKLGEGTLGVGVGLGLYFQGIDASKLNPGDQAEDAALTALRNNNNKIAPDINAGLFYHHSNFYFGISSFHTNTISYSDSLKRLTSNLSSYYITGGYNIRLNELLSLTPSVMLKTPLNAFSASSIDISTLFKYNENQFWAGLSYRSGFFKGEALIALIGLGLTKDKALRVGLAFDLTVLGTTAKAGTSYEVMLTYSKPVTEILPRPVIRTPRYRF